MNPKIAVCDDCGTEAEFVGESFEGVHFRCPDCESEWIEIDDDDDEFDIDDDGMIESRGNLFCSACGMLAQPGDEEFDWCDHRTGDGCAYMDDMDGGREDDDDYYPFDDDA